MSQPVGWMSVPGARSTRLSATWRRRGSPCSSLVLTCLNSSGSATGCSSFAPGDWQGSSVATTWTETTPRKRSSDLPAVSPRTSQLSPRSPILPPPNLATASITLKGVLREHRDRHTAKRPIRPRRGAAGPDLEPYANRKPSHPERNGSCASLGDRVFQLQEHPVRDVAEP